MTSRTCCTTGTWRYRFPVAIPQVTRSGSAAFGGLAVRARRLLLVGEDSTASTSIWLSSCSSSGLPQEDLYRTGHNVTSEGWPA